MSKRELIDVSGFLHVETEKAILFSDTGDKEDAVWLPKSQIECHQDDSARQSLITVTLPEWLAKDKGLI